MKRMTGIIACIGLLMLAWGIAATPVAQFTAPELTATRVILDATQTAVALGTAPLINGVPVSRTEFDGLLTAMHVQATQTATAQGTAPPPPANQTALSVESSQTSAAFSTRVVAITETRAVLAPTRTAVAITRNPEMLSRTPAPAYVMMTEQAIAVSTPLCRYWSDAHHYYVDLAEEIQEELQTLDMDVGIVFYVYAIGYTNRIDGQNCTDSFQQIIVQVGISGSQVDAINDDLVALLAVLDKQVPTAFSMDYPSAPLKIRWVLSTDGYYFYGLAIETEYANALQSYREGLRDEALLAALGGVIPYVSDRTFP